MGIDAGDSVRIGGTDTLNTPVAKKSVFYFHPDESPFHVTNVLTTYSKVVASAGCTVDVVYDDKIPSRYGYYTGSMAIHAHADCGPDSCINFEYLDSKYNAAGVCRVQFSDKCS